MKRVTVAITLSDDWSYVSSYDLNRIKSAMINAGVAKATENNASIASIDAKCAQNVRNTSPSR